MYNLNELLISWYEHKHMLAINKYVVRGIETHDRPFANLCGFYCHYENTPIQIY